MVSAFWISLYTHIYVYASVKPLFLCSGTVRGQVKVIKGRSKLRLLQDTLSEFELLPVCSDTLLTLQLCEKRSTSYQLLMLQSIEYEEEKNLTIKHHTVSRKGLFAYVYLFYPLLNRNIGSSVSWKKIQMKTAFSL